MAYDPKRARGRSTPKHVVDAGEPAPVDGLLDGKIEVPDWATEHDDASIEVPVSTLEVVVAADPVASPATDVSPVEPEPVVATEPEPAPESVIQPAPPVAAAPVARPAVPSRSEPPVAPVPDTPGSRWLFVAFMVAVLAAIVWQLRRRARR